MKEYQAMLVGINLTPLLGQMGMQKLMGLVPARFTKKITVNRLNFRI